MSETALVGKLPFCGHYVAIDNDPTDENRASLEKRGYVVEELPRDEAVALMNQGCDEHEPCMNVRSLRDQIEALRAQLAAKDAEIERTQKRVEHLQHGVSCYQDAIASLKPEHKEALKSWEISHGLLDLGLTGNRLAAESQERFHGTGGGR